MISKIHEALFRIAEAYPVLAAFLPHSWVVIEGDSPPFVEFDGRNFYLGKVGAEWLKKSGRERLFVSLCHIAAHFLCGHPERSLYMYKGDLESGERRAWNLACDMEANHLLKRLDNKTFGSLRPSRKSWMKKSAEEIFCLLARNRLPRGKTLLDVHVWLDPSLFPGFADIKRLVESSFGAKYLSPEVFSRALQAVDEIVSGRTRPAEVVNKSVGSVGVGACPSYGVSVVGDISSYSVPHKVFSFLVANILPKQGFMPPELDFLLLWQRRFAEIMLPYSPRHLLICIDTSASITQRILPLVASFVSSFVRQLSLLYPYCDLTLIMVDAAVQGVWVKSRSVEDVVAFLSKFRGRGGTKIFTSINDYLVRTGLVPDAIVIISDFETSDREDDLHTSASLWGIIVRDGKLDSEAIELMRKRYRKVRFLGGLAYEES